MKSHTFSRYKPVSGKETPLAIHKVIEVISQSNKSWADAAEKAVKDASHTLKGLKSIYIQDMQPTFRMSRRRFSRISTADILLRDKELAHS